MKTREEIEASNWGAKISRTRLDEYDTIMDLAATPKLRVMIHYTVESGQWRWVIEHQGVFLDDFDKRPLAIAFAKEMGWFVAGAGVNPYVINKRPAWSNGLNRKISESSAHRGKNRPRRSAGGSGPSLDPN